MNCDNILSSGLKCPYSICDQCWDSNESHEHFLSTQTYIYRYDCIHSEKTPKNFVKSTIFFNISIKKASYKSFNTKGDENHISLSDKNSDKIIDLSKSMSSQSSDDYDFYSSNYETNSGHTKRNSIDDVRIQSSNGNCTENLQEKVADSNENTVSDNESKSWLDIASSKKKNVQLSLEKSED